MINITLACDESGAKGYADQQEQFPGHVGVFAGVFVPEEMLGIAEAKLDAALAAYRLSDGKLHITDLKPQDQGALREAVYAALRELKLPCFWYAIHVAGFHNDHVILQQIREDARARAAAANPAPRVKTGSPREDPRSLHVELFQGLYSHIVAFIEERCPGPVAIDVRTDRVDAPIAKSFHEEAERLLDHGPRSTAVTGYDTHDKKVVSEAINSTTTLPPELEIKTNVQKLTITPAGNNDPLVIAADVLANGLCHHFHSRKGSDLYQDLNRLEAIERHPLADNLATFWNWGGPDLVGDRLHRHPSAPPLP